MIGLELRNLLQLYISAFQILFAQSQTDQNGRQLVSIYIQFCVNQLSNVICNHIRILRYKQGTLSLISIVNESSSFPIISFRNKLSFNPLCQNSTVRSSVRFKNFNISRSLFKELVGERYISRNIERLRMSHKGKCSFLLCLLQPPFFNLPFP